MDDNATNNWLKKKTTLLKWMNHLRVGEELKSLSQLRDGRHFSSLMRLLNNSPAQNKLKLTNWQRTVKTYLEGYYQTSLRDIINFDTASTGDEEELSKICTYMLCATFNEVNGTEQANRLTTLDMSTQEGIKSIIECILQEDTPLQQKLSASILNVARAFNAVPPAEPNGAATVAGCDSPIGQMLQSPMTIHRAVIRDKNECIRKLRQQLQEENVARSYYESEAQEFKTIAEKTENSLELLKTDNKHLKTKFDQMAFDKQQLQSELDRKDACMKKIEVEVLRLKEESAEYDSRNKLFIKTEKENIELKTKFDRLKDAYNNSKRGNELLNQLESTNEELKLKLTNKMDEIIHYKNRLEEAESEMKKMREMELERQAVESPEVPEVGERLSTIIEVELSSCREQLVHLQAALETKNDEIVQLTKDYEEKLKSLNESKASLEQRLDDMKQELTGQIAELDEAKLNLAVENGNLTVINEGLNSQMNEVKMELMRVNSKFQDEHERRLIVNKELENMISLCETQTVVLRSLTKTVEGSTADLERIECLHNEKLQRVDSGFDKLQRMFQSLECRLQKRRQKQHQITSDLEVKISSLNESCLRLEDENTTLTNLGRKNDLRYQQKIKQAKEGYQKLKLELQRQIDDLIEGKSNLENEISSQKEVITGLNDHLSKVTIERDVELSARRDADKELQNLLPKLEELENSRCQLKLLHEQVDLRSSELDVVKMKLDEMARMNEMQLASHRDELMKYEEKLADKDVILKRQLEGLQKVSMKAAIYKSQLDAENVLHKEKLQKLQNDQEILEESIKSLKEENEKLSNVGVTLDKQLKLTESELDQEKSTRIAVEESYQASVINVKEFENQLLVLKETVTSLTSDKDVLITKLDETTKANDIQFADHQHVLKKCDEDLQQAVKQAEIYRCQIESDNVGHKEEIHKYQNSLEILEESVKLLKEENEKLPRMESTIKRLDEQLNLTKANLDRENSSRIAVEESYQALMTNCEELENQLLVLKETVTSLTSEKDFFITKLDETTKANEIQLAAHQQVLEKCDEDLQQAVKQAEIYRCQIESDNAGHKEEIHKYQNSLDILEASAKSLKDENEKLSHMELTIKNLDEELTLMKINLDQEKSSRIAVEESYQASMTKCEEFENHLKVLKDTVTSMTSDKDVLMTKLDETTKANEIKLAAHEHVLKKCDEDLQQAVKQAEIYRCQLESEDAGHKEELQMWQESVESLEKSISQKELTIQSLEEQLNTMKTEMDREKCARVAVEENYQTIVANCDIDRNQALSLNETVVSLSSQIDVLKAKLDEVNNENETQLKSHQSELMMFEEALAAKDEVLKNRSQELEVVLQQAEIFKSQVESDRQSSNIHLDGLNAAIDCLKEECQSKDAEIAEWKGKYNALMKRNVSDAFKLQDEYEKKLSDADSNGRAIPELKEEILKLREQVLAGEKKHQKAVNILTKVNEDLKNECRHRRTADDAYRTELQAKDALIEQLRQQLRNKAPAAQPDRRDTFVVPKTTTKSDAAGSSHQAAANQTYRYSIDSNMPLFKPTSVDLGSTIASARGWVSCEDEEGEFHNVSYLQDLKTPKDDTGRLDELQRRNTLCLPHLRTSYPLETLKSTINFREEDLKSGNIKLNMLKPTTRQNIIDELQMDDLSDRRKTRVIQPSYHKPGPPTPGKTTKHQDSLQSKLQRTPNSVKNIFKRPNITPKSFAKYRVQSPKRHNENNPPSTYTQASPRAAVKKPTAFSIGFSPKVKKSRPVVKKDSKITTSTPMPRHGQN